MTLVMGMAWVMELGVGVGDGVGVGVGDGVGDDTGDGNGDGNGDVSVGDCDGDFVLLIIKVIRLSFISDTCTKSGIVLSEFNLSEFVRSEIIK